MPDHVNAPEMLLTPAVQNAVRERFHHPAGDPISGPRIYLENAGGGLTLKSALTTDAAINALPDNAGRDNPASREVGRVIQAGRADLRTFLNTPDGTLLADQSTTACAFRILQAAAQGVAGTNIVCSNLDHASFHDAAAVMASRHGLELRIVPLNRSTGALDPDAIAARVDAGTVSVSVIHASNITGGKTDLAATARLIRARAPQAIIVADGAQHVQHGVVDVAAAGVDAYVFSAYKVFSKPGFGFACLSPRLASFPHAQLLGKPATDWDLGTRDAGGFAAFSAVMDYLVWLGGTVAPETASDRRSRVVAAYRAIEGHEAALSRLLLHGYDTRPGMARHARVVLHGQPHHSEGREAVFAFSIADVSTGRLVQEFGRRHINVHDRVCDAYSKHTLDALGVPEILRVSLAHYNTVDEIDAFLDALGEILRVV